MPTSRQTILRKLENEIRPFEATSLPSNFSMIVYGRRRQGKTTFIKWFVYWNRFKFDEIYVFSSTSFTGHYESFVPPHHVFPSFNEKMLEALITLQKGDNSRNMLIILDDVLDDLKDIRKSDALRTLFASGRHLNMPVIVATQYPRAMTPVFRQNVDAAVIFSCDNTELREMMWKSYGHSLRSVHFCHLLDKQTSYHSALVALPCEQSSNPLDCFRWVRAESNVPPFTVGPAKLL